MDLGELQRRLIEAARSNPPSDHVPFAFERRVLAHLAARPAMDKWAQWSCVLWRAAIPYAALALVLGAWSLYTMPGSSGGGDLSQEFENVVVVALDQEPPTDSTW